MKRLHLLCMLSMFSVLLALAVQSALAKGPFGKIVISGPGLADSVTITDHHSMEALSLGMFEDFSTSIKAPHVGQGYELVRYFQREGGTFDVFDRLTYYPNPSGRAYIFYNGLEGNGWSEYDGKWFYASPEGEAALRDLLGQLGVPLTFSKDVHRVSKNRIVVVIPPSVPGVDYIPFKNPWKYSPCSRIQCWRVE